MQSVYLFIVYTFIVSTFIFVRLLKKEPDLPAGEVPIRRPLRTDDASDEKLIMRITRGADRHEPCPGAQYILEEFE